MDCSRFFGSEKVSQFVCIRYKFLYYPCMVCAQCMPVSIQWSSNIQARNNCLGVVPLPLPSMKLESCLSMPYEMMLSIISFSISGLCLRPADQTGHRAISNRIELNVKALPLAQYRVNFLPVVSFLSTKSHPHRYRT